MGRLLKHLPWYLLGFIFVATFFIWYVMAREDRGGLLTVAFLDVGEGDSIFV